MHGIHNKNWNEVGFKNNGHKTHIRPVSSPRSLQNTSFIHESQTKVADAFNFDMSPAKSTQLY